MALFLEIRNGQLKGTVAEVRHGLIIGRKTGGLTIRDSKLSSRHARIEQRADGTFWIVDLGSANGIKFGELRVREVPLEPGNGFVMGRTRFRVVKVDENPVAAEPLAINKPAPADEGDHRSFWDHIKDLIERGAAQAPMQKRTVAPFQPVLRLKFIRGLQLGTEWTVGYGPRIVGTSSPDLTLEDTTLPALCFTLEPQHRGVLFKNETEKTVRLNGQWVASELLRDGDIIEIANTQIQVEFEPLDDL